MLAVLVWTALDLEEDVSRDRSGSGREVDLDVMAAVGMVDSPSRPADRLLEWPENESCKVEHMVNGRIEK